MSSLQSSKASFSRFKKVKPQALNLSAGDRLLDKSALRPEGGMPLLIRSRVADFDLSEWAADHRREIDNDLLRHGALLFRSFDVDSAAAFEKFAAAVTDELFNENGEHPRDSVSGNVYTPVFYPPDKQLLWHNENSFNQTWPRKIMFCCQIPAEHGGETPIVDSREIYQRLEPEVRGPFERQGVMYVRNYGEGLGLDWRTVFRTGSREEVEATCVANGFRCEWKPGDKLRTRAVRPAVVRHPETGEMCWFNQAQHWHVACLDPETRESVTAVFAEEDYPRSCYYGDGSPIPDEVMTRILDLYRELEVAFSWQRQDILLLDNILTAHGRNPFQGQRKLHVAMGDMTRYVDPTRPECESAPIEGQGVGYTREGS